LTRTGQGLYTRLARGNAIAMGIGLSQNVLLTTIPRYKYLFAGPAVLTDFDTFIDNDTGENRRFLSVF
jgi:hypothetical protein